MRPFFDDAEKNHFARREPFLGARSEEPGDNGRVEHTGPRLAAIELDHQVLVAPYGHEEARRIGNALDDPSGVAAAQGSALEARMGIEVWRSHCATLAHLPAPRQAASSYSAARRRSR